MKIYSRSRATRLVYLLCHIDGDRVDREELFTLDSCKVPFLFGFRIYPFWSQSNKVYIFLAIALRNTIHYHDTGVVGGRQ